MIGRRSSLAKRFRKCEELFASARDVADSQLAMTAFGVRSADEKFLKTFNGEDAPTDLRSVSKVVTALTAGALFGIQGAFGAEEFQSNSDAGSLLRAAGHSCDWSGVEIRHLLNNTIGHENGFFFRKDLQDVPVQEYVNYAVQTPRTQEPGSHFSYSNVGPFLVSVIVQDLSGRSLESWSQELVLGPLGLSPSWKEYAGYTAGCTGLTMSCDDLLTVGELLLADGLSRQGVQLVAADWVRLMRSPVTVTPSMYDPNRVFPKFAYGYGLWVCEDGRYYCDGTDGQYLIVVPDSGLVIATTGAQSDMKPITRCMKPLL